MKRHLEYTSESSDKFWEIEVSGPSFTVTYGRNGTTGQSQTKTFIDDNKCLLEAEKLIAEKIRKGYLEDGQAQPQELKPISPKQSDLQMVLNEYTELIQETNLAGLLPFLKNRTKGHTAELKKHIRKAKVYWLSYIDLTEDNVIKDMLTSGSRWGMRATEAQKDIIVLSAIALFNQKEIASWDEAINCFGRLEERPVYDLITWAKPSWINSFLLDKVKKNEWLSVPYEALRLLEKEGIIVCDPELFTRTMVMFKGWNRGFHSGVLDYIKYLLHDETACIRDIPELFNYETSLQNQSFEDPATNKYNGLVLWEIVFNRLLNENKIDRLFYIENCLLIQTKEWNSNLRSFFRKRFADAKPTVEELLLFQNIIFHFLHSPLNAVVNFGIDVIKNICQEKDFNLQDFFDWVEPVMMRGDCKGGIRTLLGIFDKIIKTQPEFKQKISYLVADVFVIADLTLQERAYKTFEKVSGELDTSVAEKLEMYLPQMQGNVAVLIGAFLKVETPDTVEPDGNYSFVLQKHQFLRDNRKVVPFKDWNEILFQFGIFISSQEVIEGEKLVNAFITQQSLFPADAMEQMRVYSNQLQKTYFGANNKNVISGMLAHIIEGKDGIYNPDPISYRDSKVINLTKEILFEAQRKITAKSVLPLLSFPTHTPHWVDPVVLVQRLLEYQNVGWEADPLDFTIAISRMPRENTEEALQLCKNLEKDKARLMTFALGGSDHIELKQDTFFSKIFSISKSEKLKNQAIWAVAARTFYPDRKFTAFDGTSLVNLPNVSHPFVPDAKLVTKRNEYKNYLTQEIQHYEFRELSVTLPQSELSTPHNLLYSLDVYERKSNYYYGFLLSHGDVLYWHSLMPQNDQALATMLLKSSCKNTESGSEELNGFLYVSAQPEFIFTETSLLVLACSMFCKNSKTRSYASEILIYLIKYRKIDVTALGEKVAYLISENYGPVQRFTDVLSIIRDVSSLHNSAIIILLDAVILNFAGKDKLPVNFKRLLELYLDLLMKTRSKPDDRVLESFLAWKDYNAIRPVLRQIQSI
ncbi:DUF6493 family protein [Dyadobacter diqingensis]|uniref:DUF6493 family protein n=1 Tax=Dyadobacter diqingensis TaxID=2938121 RepID=UPI0020C19966|nr:DUF6493 family protein [Dyadobacter diqingensis]